MIVRFRPLGALRTGATLLLLAALTLVTLARPGLAQNPVPLPVAGVTAEAPPGWWENGSKLDAYVVGTDTTQPHVKPVSAYVKSTSDTTGSFGGMMQSILPTKYLGQRVRLSAWVKTRDAVKGAHLWLRIDGANQRVLAFDNMNDRPVTGTSDWTACSVVLDVAPEAVGIAYGFFLSDTGQAWINDLKFEVVPPEVAATSRPRPDSPVNLDFSPAANR